MGWAGIGGSFFNRLISLNTILILLQRITEQAGVVLSLDPKPIEVD